MIASRSEFLASPVLIIILLPFWTKIESNPFLLFGVKKILSINPSLSNSMEISWQMKMHQNVKNNISSAMTTNTIAADFLNLQLSFSFSLKNVFAWRNCFFCSFIFYSLPPHWNAAKYKWYFAMHCIKKKMWYCKVPECFKCQTLIIWEMMSCKITARFYRIIVVTC